ncbi:MAG: Arc family DNA-binding protein [Candidatus Faecimonas sp.]|nr:Arc family DNA-binding protein [Mycoplasmatota bacterium]MDY2908275.1 Arc family DNA-binding protein [Candidatus Faecimonas sp.]
MMHKFLLRIRQDVFDLVKSEANSRGISINDFLVMCIEDSLVKYMIESADAFKDMVISKAIRKERKRLRNE